MRSTTLTRRAFVRHGALLGAAGLGATLLAACQPAPAAPPAAPSAPPAAPAGAPAAPAAPAQAPAAKAAPEAKPSPAAAGQPRRGGTLRIAYDQEHKTLDPHLSTQIPERFVMYAVYNTLVAMGSDFSPQPELALSWSNPDPKSFVFKLRPGVKFHDGTDCDAEAVKWNVERIKNPDTKSVQAPQLAVVSSVEVVDPLTVKFNLSEPYAPLLSQLMDRPGFIVSPAAVKKFGADFGRNPVGTGPFKFVQWAQDQGVTVERNPSYWDSSLPYLDRIEFKVVNDPTVRVTMLKARELDLIDRFEARAVPLVQGDGELKLLEFKGGVWYGFQWQVDKPPFDNKALRQAIAWGLNREVLGRVLWDGRGSVATAPVAIPWAGSAAVTPIGFDQARAKSLLAQAGKAGGFEETLTIRARPDDVRFGELLQSQLAEIGVKVNLAQINPNDWTVASRQRTINWTTVSWTQRADPDGLLRLLYRSNGSANTTGYKSPEVDSLIDQAAAQYDQATRTPLYQKIQQQVVDDAPYVYVWHPAVLYGLNRKVEGFQHSPDDVLRVRTLWLSA